MKASQDVLAKRLNEIKPFYDKRLGDKDDAKPLDAEYFRLKSFGRIPEQYAGGTGVPMPGRISVICLIMSMHLMQKVKL